MWYRSWGQVKVGCEIHLVTPEEQQDYGGSPRVWIGIRNGLRRAERMLMH